ncbi:MAG: flagellar biosynthesis protein FliQ [Syntrophomonadaceae bacterium]|jgi:flagellar biosynthetic protein FliQ
MSSEAVIAIAREAIMLALLLAAPALGVGLLVGFVISVFQAITQIQEQTLTFVPKIIAVFLSFIVFGPWMLKIITEFTVNIFSNLTTIVR